MSEQETGMKESSNSEQPDLKSVEILAKQENAISAELPHVIPTNEIKPYGYWRDIMHIETEVRKLIESGLPLTQKTLQESGSSGLASAISRHYEGGIEALKRKLDPGYIDLQNRREFWKDSANIERAAREAIANGISLTSNSLRENDLRSLDNAIYANYPGNLHALREKLGIEILRKNQGYWTDPVNIESEARQHVASGKILSGKELATNGLASLPGAANINYPGGLRTLREKLGQAVEKKENGFWERTENIEAEARKAIANGMEFSQKKLHKAGFSSLSNAISINYPGGYHAMREKLGLEALKRVRRGYWENPENIESAAKSIIEHGGKLSSNDLKKLGQSGLSFAIDNKYPGGIRGLRKKIGIEENGNFPRGYWQNVENIENEARKIFLSEGTFDTSLIKKYKILSLANAINDYYPGGLRALQEKFGVEPKSKPNGYWTQEKIEEEARTFFEGKRDFRKSLVGEGRWDLLGAISTQYEGGMVGLKEKLGIELIRKSNNYWTKENLLKAAREFLDEHGDINHVLLRAGDVTGLSFAITQNYPDGMVGLKRDLGIDSHRMPNGYWTQETIEEEARKIIEREGYITLKILDNLGMSQLSRAIYDKYPGGLNALKEKLGIIEQNQQISPDEADEFMRSFEIEQ